MNELPVIVQNSRGMALVEVDGQAVVTAKNLAEGLGYKKENSVRRIFIRNKESFKDYGVFDLTRERQFDAPLSEDDITRCGQIDHTCDTAVVRMLTASAPDGRGGGLQDVRVFTKRGALKVCMKSNQPRAVMVQEMLIDLYEKVESGQLIGAERFGKMMQSLLEEFSEIKKDVATLKSRPVLSLSLPDDTALPISVERRRRGRTALFGGLKYPDVREMVIHLRRSGVDFDGIVEAIKAAWPEDEERWISRSAAHRFWTNAKMGYFKEFGIDVTVH